ncbi:unnamed protein product [Pleuronectes platessa]|uniref:Uncharacterized protein n=1 Tax=Pleuronectes platessa TaxID=8262 RepID=A0A9N7UBR0_PLEPL|nr:unnamed protein product [Pleuronectes platessa]
MSEEEKEKLSAVPFMASPPLPPPPPLKATHENSSFQTGGGRGCREAMNWDGDTKNVISSSHSRVLPFSVRKLLDAVGVVQDQACVRPRALLIAYIVQPASRRGGRRLPAFKGLPN